MRNPALTMLHRHVVALLMCGLFLACLPQAKAQPRQDHCVVLISVDGLAGFYLDDPKADMPTIRGLAKAGARAQGMLCSFPSVTWPNHTTLVTGVYPARHGVIGNNFLDRTTGKPVPFIPDPLFDKDEIVKVETVYDAAHKAGLTTSGIIWPATRNAKTLNWTVPDMAGDDAWTKYGSPTWVAELQAAGYPIDKHGGWCKDSGLGGVQRDYLYTRLADHVLQKHSPNLLMIHLIELDHVEHKFGPQTPEAYFAVRYEDDRVRDIVESVRKSPKADRTTFIVASDHGFFRIDKDIKPNVMFKAMSPENTPIEKRVARAVSQGGGCMIYLLDPAKKEELLKTLPEQLAQIEGVDQVLTAADFHKIGQSIPSVDKNAPDLWIGAKQYYAFSDSDAGPDIVVPKDKPVGTHGFLPDHPDMLGTLVLSGAGIKPGTNFGKSHNIHVAPTIAKLLGIDLKGTDGKPIDAALK